MTTLIRALKPNQVYETIRARICRLWTNNDLNTGRLISLDCVLVDEEVIFFTKYNILLFSFNTKYYKSNNYTTTYIYSMKQFKDQFGHEIQILSTKKFNQAIYMISATSSSQRTNQHKKLSHTLQCYNLLAQQYLLQSQKRHHLFHIIDFTSLNSISSSTEFNQLKS